MIGVYFLRFGTSLLYIGQSTDVHKRISVHISKLNRGVHTSKLQDAFALFSTPTIYKIIECNKEDLDELEEFCISFFDTINKGCNIQSTPSGGCGLSRENSPTSKYRDTEMEDALYYLAYHPELTLQQISNLTKVSRDTVASISCYKAHYSLYESFPEATALMKQRGSHRYQKNKTLKDLGKLYPRLISPEGIAYTVENCSQFSKEHNLNNAHVIQVLKGKERQHKGWRAEE